MTNNAKKMILLGFDGQDPKLSERLMEEGKLPNFARLAQADGYAKLSTTNPAQSPVAWTTLATGVGPGYHGVFDFLEPMPEEMLVDLAIHNMVPDKGAPSFERVRQHDAFWDVTSAAGLHTSVIRWPVTFPAEQVTGQFISGLGTPDILGRLGKYTFFQTKEPMPDDEAPEKVQRLQKNGDIWVGELQGPQVSGLLGGTSTSSIEFKLYSNGNQSMALELPGNKPVPLRVGEWPPWLNVKFKVGFMKSVSAIFKCVLMQAGNEPELHTSPLEIDPRDPAFPISHPDRYAARLADDYGLFHTLGMPEDTNGVTDTRYQRKQFLNTCDEVMAEREFMLDRQLQEFDDSGVLAVVFDTSDRIQHLFWASQDPEHPIRNSQWQDEWNSIIEESYQQQDAILGKVLQQADDNTVVMTFSDHGFNTFRRAVHLNYWLTKEGYMDADLGTDGDATTLFRTVNWNNTVAYACGFGGIYLNRKGRESEGIVDPGDEAAGLRTEIAEKLSQIVDEDTGEQPIREVFTRDQIFPGPLQDQAPDLFVGFRPGYRVSDITAIGGGINTLVEDNDDPWCGDHLMHPDAVPGVLFANRPIATDNPSAYDIAPTVLRYFGLDIPDTVTGNPAVEFD